MSSSLNKEFIILLLLLLYNFEQSTLDDFCAENNLDSYIKSTDISDPISPPQRPRGREELPSCGAKTYLKTFRRLLMAPTGYAVCTCNTEKDQ